MTTRNTKTSMVTSILAIAASMTMASCLSDSSSNEPGKPMEDSAAMVSADSSSMPKPVARKRQGKVSATFIGDNSLRVEKDKEGIYSKAEKMPEYPGGETALSAFMEKNINYPQDAIDQDAEGTVNVSFVIDEKGKVMNPVAGGKLGHGLDEEAIKIVKQMPAWKPGMVKGKPVKTRLVLPVTFKLADA